MSVMFNGKTNSHKHEYATTLSPSLHQFLSYLTKQGPYLRFLKFINRVDYFVYKIENKDAHDKEPNQLLEIQVPNQLLEIHLGDLFHALKNATGITISQKSECNPRP